MHKGFWGDMGRNAVGMAPMDGVTDAAFRYMVCSKSRPSFVVTEFVNVEGLARGAVEMLKDFAYDEIERPVVAQIFGVEVDSFYKTAVMVAAMGFDGVDINMGCPAGKVAKRGAGAGLIQNPDLACEIIGAVQKGVTDWANGVTLEEAGVHPAIIAELELKERREIPVSVKTRIGYSKESVDEWIGRIAACGPACISVHGRTLKQGYLGKADWEAIRRAGEIAHDAGCVVVGNGDVDSMEVAEARIAEYGVDGVMVGRAVFGNPWFFGGGEASVEDRFAAVREHVEIFEEKFKDLPFFNIKKHLAWYCKGFSGAREMRMKLMMTSGAEDVDKILNEKTDG